MTLEMSKNAEFRGTLTCLYAWESMIGSTMYSNFVYTREGRSKKALVLFFFFVVGGGGGGRLWAGLLFVCGWGGGGGKFHHYRGVVHVCTYRPLYPPHSLCIPPSASCKTISIMQ